MKYKAIIFDLDQTLIDSSAIEQLRSSRQWSKVMQNLHLIQFNSLIASILKELTKEKIKIGIITNSPRMYAEAVLISFNIKYDALIAFHDVNRRKPDPEAFIKMLKLLDVTCHECISVGDQDNDILASQRANIAAIGVNWHSAAYSFSVGPSITVLNPNDFMSHLKL